MKLSTMARARQMRKRTIVLLLRVSVSTELPATTVPSRPRLSTETKTEHQHLYRGAESRKILTVASNRNAGHDHIAGQGSQE